MAIRPITRERVGHNAALFTWTLLANGDTGEVLDQLDYTDACIQFGGTFASGTIVWEGSNDGVTFFTLNDAQSSAISKSAASIEQVAEVPRYVRPRVSAGTGSTSLTATLYARRGRA